MDRIPWVLARLCSSGCIDPGASVSVWRVWVKVRL